MQFIAEKTGAYYRLGFYEKFQNAIPTTIYHADLLYLQQQLHHYLNRTLNPDTVISFLDIHNNLFVMKYLHKTNNLLFGVVLDDVGNQFKLNVIDATHAREVLKL